MRDGFFNGPQCTGNKCDENTKKATLRKALVLIMSRALFPNYVLADSDQNIFYANSDPEEFKAWSQNLGHQSVLTTLYSYGDVPDYRQAELIKKLSQPRVGQSQYMQAAIEGTIKEMMDK